MTGTMKTRDKILQISQELFNKKGIGKVSVRNICEDLKISLGNFTYYFPDKQRIVIELYHRMTGEIESAAGTITANRDSIVFLLELHNRLFKIQNSYKFFYLNNFELLNNFHEIREAYQQHRVQEGAMMRALFRNYVDKGIFKKNIEETHFERLISIAQMVNSFWIIEAELNFKGSEKRKLIYYLQLCCSMLEPYLSPTALEEYSNFFRNIR
jgi:AcrR family transcriptional regulator